MPRQAASAGSRRITSRYRESCSTASIVPIRLISTATQPSSSSRHIRSTGPTSVGHSRRTRRRPGSTVSRQLRERLLEVPLDAVLLEPRVLAQLVLELGEELRDPDLEPVLVRPARLRTTITPSPSSITVGGVIQFNGLIATAVRVDEHRAVGLEDEQADRLRQVGGEAAGVGDLAAGDDETHGRWTVAASPDAPPTPAHARRMRGTSWVAPPSGWSSAPSPSAARGSGSETGSGSSARSCSWSR